MTSWLVALRAMAFAVIIALVLDVPVTRPRPARPAVFVDASLSMARNSDAVWRAAWDSARAAATDSMWAFGDTLRPIAAGKSAQPADLASRLRPVVERTMVAGRPAIIITDGEVEDSSALDGLPSGSRVLVLPRGSAPDVAMAGIEAPRAAVSGDSLALRLRLVAGSAGAAAGTVTLFLNAHLLGTWPLDAMSAWGERQLDVRVRIAGAQGPGVLRAIVNSPGDAEPRNDTLSTALELSRAASAVFVSTSPDQDARFALAVLRGSLSLPTRGFLRVAPGNWRLEGALTSVPESEVRAAVRDAPIVILHGDTSVFGSPRAATAGPLALMVPPDDDDGEWYPTGVPVSPLSAALAALPVDSLPPLSAGQPAHGDWTALEARRGREAVKRAVIVGTDAPRRTIVVSASGFWRWRFRGGAGADAYAALWGGIFDWLAAERADKRAAVPDAGGVRAGDVIRWRRGSGADSAVRVTLRRRGTAHVDTLDLHFAPGNATAERAAPPQGVYDVEVSGGTAVLAVNAAAELLPAQPRVRSGRVGRRPALDNARHARSMGWLYVLAVVLLCMEWLLRRRAGLR